jgi:hydrogenase maturation protein HypF
VSNFPESAERSRDGSRDRDTERLQVRLIGTVQGVGFRPFVFRLATELDLTGWVRNDGDGVTIEVEARHSLLLCFLERLTREKPAAATIHAADHRFLPPVGYETFEIVASEATGTSRVWISPDLAMCDDCRRELRDSADRRHRYPFLNCTNCGPRYSIIDALPYDRPNTSMRSFAMCANCASEYDSPSDRRFHAQPVACADCGPGLVLRSSTGVACKRGATAVDQTIEIVREGGIVAIKGLGGYHLIIDAGNEKAAAELRRRKRRSHKAFAVMYPDLDALRSHVHVPSFAEPFLRSTQAPILILPRTARGRQEIAPSVAPQSPYLGVFLPYTPLHQLLLDALSRPVVATSGNMTDEPIQYLDDQAHGELAGLCDGFLDHDRPILRPVDDSVLHVVARPRPKPQMLRRARGYSPLPILASRDLPPIVALGGQMNVTLALSRDREVILSQHLGDMDSFEARSTYERTLADLTQLYDLKPERVAHDLHPDYFTSDLARRMDLPRVEVQHHHAHLAACMLENQLEGEVLGLTWDGTGYGPDRTVWGGEVLLGGPEDYRRVGSLVPFRLPGGEKAIEQTWRTGISLLRESYGRDFPRDLPLFAEVSDAECGTIVGMLETGVNAPVTTSLGRLFDGVSALLGLCTHNTHQAQSAQLLEWAAWDHGVDATPLPMTIVEDDLLRLDWRAMIRTLVEARRDGTDLAQLAASFHHAIVRSAMEIVRRVGNGRVVLAGGVFCNRYLTEALLIQLDDAGLDGHIHDQLPPTDGSLAVGQMWVAAHR